MSVFLISIVASFLAVKLMNIRWRHRTEAQWESETMLLVQPSIRRFLGIWMLGIVGVVVLVAWHIGWLSLSRGLIAVGVWLPMAGLIWTVGRRKIAVSSGFVEARGLAGRRISWRDLEAVEGVVRDKRSFVIFKAENGSVVPVDSTLYGWEEFLEKAPDVARDAGADLQKAIRSVKRLEG
jgi:hypothetical protein